MYLRQFTETLRLLSRAFDIAEARGVPRPVIVGGSAVEHYPGGELTSGDLDLVSVASTIRTAYRSRVRLGALFEGRTDRNRLQVVIVDEAHGGTVTFPPVEDMIADRFGQLRKRSQWAR